jgi:hypothetical protein
MDANRKIRSRGILKGKIAPLFRTTKPSLTLEYTTTTNVKPNHSSPSPASHVVVVQKDYSKPSPKVSIVVTDYWNDNFPTDESVDLKAAIYISMVQQRLKAEQKQVQEN